MSALEELPPSRVRRLRTAGFKLPKNTVCVNRPGKWGNPFTIIEGQLVFIDPWGTRSQNRKAISYLRILTVKHMTKKEQHNVLTVAFKAWLNGKLSFYGVSLPRTKFTEPISKELIKKELAGKNIACFCPLDLDCHGDVYLEIANE